MQNKKRLHRHLLLIYIIYFAALIVGFAASFVPDFSRGWRDAQDTLEIMEEHCDWSQGGVIHCFSYSVEMARIYLKKGFYLGIGGVVTFKNGRKLVEVVKEAPLEQLVLETDSPYLTPVPNRGKRNDSRQLTHVVDAIAQIKGISREEVIRVTEQNARRMYRIRG